MTTEQPQIEPLHVCATCAAVIHPDRLLDHSVWHGKQIEWFAATNTLIEQLVESVGLLIELLDLDDDAPSASIIPFPYTVVTEPIGDPA